jgi:hypothetical protein
MEHSHKKPTHCPNCGQPLSTKDNYCRNCGQENRDLQIPFWHLVSEALEGIVHFDSKFFQTTKALVFKPGFLAKEFNLGKRRTHVPPVRLYIFISFIFFLLITFKPGKHYSSEPGKTSNTEQKDFFDSDLFRITFFSIDSKDMKGLNETQIDSLMVAKGIERSRLNKYMAYQIARITSGGKTEFNHQLLKGLSYMMFILMPLFGLILFIFYRKQTKYYLDCLIFSIYFHSFIFLLLIVYSGLNRLTGSLYLFLAIPIIITIYFFFALRAVYKQSVLMTLLKTTAIASLHLVSFLLCFLLMVISSIVLF